MISRRASLIPLWVSVTFRPNNIRVRTWYPQEYNELAQHRGRDVPIAVDEAEIAASAEPEAYAQRMAFALVDRQVDDLDLRAELSEADITSVSRAVRDSDDLEADPAVTQHLDHLRDKTGQIRSGVVVRDHHRQIELASRLHRSVPHYRGRVPTAGADLA